MIFPNAPDPRYFMPSKESILALPPTSIVDAFMSRPGGLAPVPPVTTEKGECAIDDKGRIILPHAYPLPSVLSATQRVGTDWSMAYSSLPFVKQGGGASVANTEWPFGNTYGSLWNEIAFSFAQPYADCGNNIPIYQRAGSEGSGLDDLIVHNPKDNGVRAFLFHTKNEVIEKPQDYKIGKGQFTQGASNAASAMARIVDGATSPKDLSYRLDTLPEAVWKCKQDPQSGKVFFPYVTDSWLASSILFTDGRGYFDETLATIDVEQNFVENDKAYDGYDWVSGVIKSNAGRVHEEYSAYTHFGINAKRGQKFTIRFGGQISLSGTSQNGNKLAVGGATYRVTVYRVTPLYTTSYYLTDDPSNAEVANRWPRVEKIREIDLLTIPQTISERSVAFDVVTDETLELEAGVLYVFEQSFVNVTKVEEKEESIEMLASASMSHAHHQTRWVASIRQSGYSSVINLVEPSQ